MIEQTRQAFSLAEVLITLAIIGIVASISIPALQANINNNEFKTLYRKAFAEAQQVMLKVAQENILENRVNQFDINNYNAFMEIKSKFNIAVDCTSGISGEIDKCWDRSGESSSGAPWDQSPAFITTSGMSWAMRCAYGGTCSIQFFLIDTNGLKGPNKYGKDRWTFYLKDKNDLSFTGIPIKLAPVLTDYTSTNAYNCPTGPCYYKSWLIGDE